MNSVAPQKSERMIKRGATIMRITVAEYREHLEKEEKRCTGSCKEWKHKSQFPLDATRSDGRGCRCLACNNEYRKAKEARMAASQAESIKPFRRIKEEATVKKQAAWAKIKAAEAKPRKVEDLDDLQDPDADLTVEEQIAKAKRLQMSRALAGFKNHLGGTKR